MLRATFAGAAASLVSGDRLDRCKNRARPIHRCFDIYCDDFLCSRFGRQVGRSRGGDERTDEQRDVAFAITRASATSSLYFQMGNRARIPPVIKSQQLQREYSSKLVTVCQPWQRASARYTVARIARLTEYQDARARYSRWGTIGGGYCDSDKRRSSLPITAYPRDVL